MGTVPQNMSQTTDNPGATSLLSTLLNSVVLLASSTVTRTEHDPGDSLNKTIETFLLCDIPWLLSGILDRGNTEMDRKKIASWKKSSEEIKILGSAGYKDWLGTDISNILTSSHQSSENEDQNNAEAQPSFLAYSILFCFLLFPSLLENKKYQASIDYHHESSHLKTSAMSEVFPATIQTFEI